jgi:hypothetical protein
LKLVPPFKAIRLTVVEIAFDDFNMFLKKKKASVFQMFTPRTVDNQKLKFISVRNEGMYFLVLIPKTYFVSLAPQIAHRLRT